MEYKIEHIPNQYFAYMRRVGVYGQENYKLMTDFKAWASENNLLNDTSAIYGIARDDVRTTEAKDCRYDVAIAIETEWDFKNSEVKSAIFVLEGKYLIFKIEHTAEAISEFWNNIFALLENENFEINTERIILERYSVNLVNEGFCEMCVPI